MIVITAEDFTDADSQAMSAAYLADLDRLLPDGFSPGNEFVHGEDFEAPGVFLVARNEGQAVGCGGLRLLDEETGEVKHMWVDARTRRLGVGREILAALEEHARAVGLRRLVLDTSAHLDPAVALYRAAGFAETKAYNDNPFAQLWFEKALV